ncbi:MAG: hypothetical protein V2A69_15975 [Pseudomonadota bacterium]
MADKKKSTEITDDDLVKTEENMAITEATVTKKSAILLAIHRAQQTGRNLSNDDLAWNGTILTNKDITILICDTDNQQHAIKVPGNKPYRCGINILQQLVVKAIQEGPLEMRQNFYAEGGMPRDAKPLRIEVLENGFDPNTIQAHKTTLIPSLV